MPGCWRDGTALSYTRLCSLIVCDKNNPKCYWNKAKIKDFSAENQKQAISGKEIKQWLAGG